MKASTVEFYEDEAEIYDEERFTSPTGKLTDAIQKELVLKLCDFTENTLILDVGTGTGRFAIEFARNGAVAVGLDPSKSMVKLAKSKSVREKVCENVNFVVADAHKLPFRGDSFDLSVSINVLNHIPDYINVLAEVARILKQKGYFLANFPSMQSFYFPIALFVNLHKRALFNNVYSRWFTLGAIRKSFSKVGLSVQDTAGFPIIVSPPFPKKLWFPMARTLRKGAPFSSSLLKYFSGNLFIRGQKIVGNNDAYPRNENTIDEKANSRE